MTLTPERCELCGDKYHLYADSQPGWANLQCPGAIASEPDKEAFRQALTHAFADWVRAHSDEQVTEAEKLADDLYGRKRDWYARNRANVTQDVLQADCDKRVPEVTAEIDKSIAESPAQLDVDPAHVTVPPTEDMLPQKTWTRVKHATKAKDSDYLLFVDPPQVPDQSDMIDYYDAKAPGGWRTEHHKDPNA